MKIEAKNIVIFILCVLLCIVIVKNCRCNKKVEITEVVKYDTVKFKDSVYFLAPTTIVSMKTDTIFIDTNKVIKDYYSMKDYDVQVGDSNVKANTHIRISRNQLEFAKFDYNLFNKHYYTTITEYKEPTFTLCAGAAISYSIPNNKIGININMSVVLKRHGINAGFDVINRAPHIGYFYTIIQK